MSVNLPKVNSFPMFIILDIEIGVTRVITKTDYIDQLT